METITYENIKVEGFAFDKILQIELFHTINTHGEAVIVGEVESSKVVDLVSRIDKTTIIKITTTAQKQISDLFIGCVSDVAVTNEELYSQVKLKLITLGALLDLERKNKSFQVTTNTYGDIIQEVTTGNATIQIEVSDKATNTLIVQYNETDWDFTKRMASGLNAPIVSVINEANAKIHIGIPSVAKTINVESSAFKHLFEHIKYENFSENSGLSAIHEDFALQKVASYEYALIGDLVNFNDISNRIKTVSAKLVDGILEMVYGVFPYSMSSNGDIVELITNIQISGKMLIGTVKSVDKDKVKVHLTDIDENYDASGDWEFPFSTAYSSTDGSGWYCMPEIDDTVRVFFPTCIEGGSFAASCEFAIPPSNPKNKSWKAPAGKEILLSEEGLYIIGNSGKVFISLTDDDGIKIHSDKDITVSSDTMINIVAGNDVKLVASNEIVVGTEDAYLNIKKDSISLVGKEILVN